MTKIKKTTDVTNSQAFTLTTVRDNETYTFEYDPAKFTRISDDMKPLGVFAKEGGNISEEIALRIDDICMAWHYMMDVFAKDQRLMSASGNYKQPNPKNSKFWHDDKTNEDKYATPQHYFDWLNTEFSIFGCVYLLVHTAYESYKGLNNDHTDDKTYDVAVWASGDSVYSSKYKIGTNMFYSTDGNSTLHSSRIDALVITRPSEYAPDNIKYTMSDGKTVSEDQLVTADMAHEWINSKQ